MTYKSTPEVVDPYRLTGPEFQQFIQWMPHQPLKDAGISRASFNSVAYSLSRHVTFKTGEGIRITQAGLVEESGCSHNTVRKVIAFLKHHGVLELVGHQRHQGSPSENYRFRTNTAVKGVIERKDKGPKPKSTKKQRESKKMEGVSVDTLIEPVDTLIEPVDTLIEPVDNNKVNNTHRVNKVESVTTVPSSASIVAQPTASDDAGEQENKEKKIPTIEELTAGMEPVFGDDFKVPVVKRSGSKTIDFVEPVPHDDVKLNEILSGF